MKRTLKAAFAAILAVIMLITAVPLAVFAENRSETPSSGPQPILLGDADQDGSISVGDALIIARAVLANQTLSTSCDVNQDGAVTISDALLTIRCAMRLVDWVYVNPDDDSISGSYTSVDVYSITELEIDTESMIATATVNAPDNCDLLVRFIEEEVFFAPGFSDNRTYIDGGSTNASHVVPADSDMASISAQISNALPEFFVAEAILIDSDGNALCNPYSTIENTERYREFSEKTVYDFDDELTVLNFDSSIDNNFGVLSPDVISLTASSIERDYETNTYYIEGISSPVEAGDKVFIKDSAGNPYLFKVKSCTDGEVTTVTAASADDNELGFFLKDFYQFLKVDMEYEGMTEPQNKSIDLIDISADTSLSINPSIEYSTSHFELSGGLDIKVNASVSADYDIVVFGPDYLDFNFSYSLGIDTELNAKAKTADPEYKKETVELSFGKVRLPFAVTGLDAFADFKACVEFAANVGFKLNGSSTSTHGFNYNSKNGAQKIDEKDVNWSADVAGHAEILFGPKPSVGIEFLDGVLSAGLDCFLGVKAEADAVVPVFDGGTSKHMCDLCVNGEVKVAFDVDAKLKYKISERLSGSILDWNILSYELKLFGFYVSLHNDPNSMFEGTVHYGKGSCPNYAYSTNFRAFDASCHDSTDDIIIRNNKTGALIATVSSGDYLYLIPNTYVARTNINGVNCEKIFTVDSSAQTVILFQEDIPAEAVEYNGHMYCAFDTALNWYDAKQYCEQSGGHLACISDAAENSFVFNLISPLTRNVYWLGGYKDGTAWTWVTGENWGYTHWGYQKPDNHNNLNEDKLQMFRIGRANNSPSTWNDAPYNAEGIGIDFYNLENTGFVCEWDYLP